MKRFEPVFTFAAAMAIICCASSVKAQQGAKPIVLTPTALYDKIEALEKHCAKLDERNSKTLKVLLSNNARLQDLEHKIRTNHEDIQNEKTTREERIRNVEDALLRTRDQVANMFVMLRKKQ